MLSAFPAIRTIFHRATVGEESGPLSSAKLRRQKCSIDSYIRGEVTEISTGCITIPECDAPVSGEFAEKNP